MKFYTDTLNLGNINSNRTYSVFFGYEPDHNIKDVQITVSCSCGVATWKKEASAIALTISTGSIPQHLKEVGHYALNKSLAVICTNRDNTVEQHILNIIGVVHK